MTDTPKRKITKAAPKGAIGVGKRKAGQPTAYKKEYAELARKFALLGANDERLAFMFEVSIATISNWKNDHPEFLEALKEGKEYADANVANSLYHRALGYEHPEDDIRAVNGEIVITKTIKRYPPDTGAATLWLKNRQPTIWRDKVENVVTGPDGGPVQHAVKIKFV